MSETVPNKVPISLELSNLNLLTFPFEPEDIHDFIANLEEIQTTLVDTVSQFTLEFVKNSQNLLNGDLSLIVGSKGFEQASSHFKAAMDGYQNLLEDLKKDDIGESPLGSEDLVNFELAWRHEYSKGRMYFSLGSHVFENDQVQSLNLLSVGVEAFSKAVDCSGKLNAPTRVFHLLGCFFHTKGLLLLNQAITSQDQLMALKFCYSSLTHLKKAKFLGQPHLDSNIEAARNQIQDYNISRIEKSAEECWSRGLTYSNEKKFQESLKLLERGSAVYRGLQRLDNREEFVLQEKLLRVSALESHANLLLDSDKNESASEKFRRASFALRDVAEYVRAMDKEALAEGFEFQKQYFEGMSTFAQGIVNFDNDEVENAIIAFKNAQKILESTLNSARSSGNTVLLEQCANALNQVASYLETAAAVQESE